ncbi:MAG: AAA family ATPase [Atopobiaceae bacterium]|nr:AAA family ATPase [Atopobiaceae bacterium]
MARTISIGAQGFEDIRSTGCFYVDKTGFVRDWWLAGDAVTLVCRPRRFGKTLNLDTVRCFLSTEYAGRGEELFGGLDVWEGGEPRQREEMRALQGTVPVVALSLARVKQGSFEQMLRRIEHIMVAAARAHAYLDDWDGLTDTDRAALSSVREGMGAERYADVPNMLCGLLRRFHGVRPVVLLDEYGAPIEAAWTGGYRDEAGAAATRS